MISRPRGRGGGPCLRIRRRKGQGDSKGSKSRYEGGIITYKSKYTGILLYSREGKGTREEKPIIMIIAKCPPPTWSPGISDNIRSSPHKNLSQTRTHLSRN